MIKHLNFVSIALTLIILSGFGKVAGAENPAKQKSSSQSKNQKITKANLQPKMFLAGMQYVNGGSFVKGNTEKILASKNDTTLLVGITKSKDSVAGFYISDHEVTNAEYRAFVLWVRDSMSSIGNNSNSNFYTYSIGGNQHQINIYPDTKIFQKEYSYTKDDPMAVNYFTDEKYNDHPVVGVSWQQANAYCHWRTVQYNKTNKNQPVEFRLPTEAEWEFAALGKASKKIYHDEYRLYPWDGIDTRNIRGSYMANFGNSIDQNNLYVKYYVNDGYFLPAPVKAFKPNEYKLYNMAGNVAEWTIDKPAEYLMNEQNAAAFEKNPDARIVKGGSWANGSAYLFCGGKEIFSENKSSSRIGFRVVMKK
mgnify:CR=1 FL=1